MSDTSEIVSSEIISSEIIPNIETYETNIQTYETIDLTKDDDSFLQQPMIINMSSDESDSDDENVQFGSQFNQFVSQNTQQVSQNQSSFQNDLDEVEHFWLVQGRTDYITGQDDQGVYYIEWITPNGIHAVGTRMYLSATDYMTYHQSRDLLHPNLHK
jgi:hypothetical protein